MKGKYKIAVIIVIYLCIFLLIYAFGFYLLRWQPNVNKGQTKVPADEVPEGVELVSLKEVESFSVTPGAVDYGCPKILKNGLLFYDGSGSVQFYNPFKNILISKKFDYVGDYAKFFITSNYLVMCSYVPEKAYIAEFMNPETSLHWNVAVQGSGQVLVNGEIFLKHRLTESKGEVSYIEILSDKAYIFYGLGYFEILDIKDDKIIFKNETLGTIMDVSLQKKGGQYIFLVLCQSESSQYEIKVVDLNGLIENIWHGDEAPFISKIMDDNLIVLRGNRDNLNLVSLNSGKLISEKIFPFTIEEIRVSNGYIFIYGATYQRPEDSSTFSAHFLILSKGLSPVREFSSSDTSINFVIQDQQTLLNQGSILISNEKGEIETLTPSKEIRFSVPSAMKEVLNGNILYVISKSGKYIYLVDTESGTLTKVLVSRTSIWQGEIFDGKVYFLEENYTNSRVDVAIYSE